MNQYTLLVHISPSTSDPDAFTPHPENIIDEISKALIRHQDDINKNKLPYAFDIEREYKPSEVTKITLEQNR